MTRIRSGVILLGLAALLSMALAACSGGSGSTAISGSTTTQSGTQTTLCCTTSTEIGATSEYVTIGTPVVAHERLFKASTTGAEAELRAGPFASALETWSAELSSFSWPTAAQADVRTLIADIPPLVTDLKGVAAGDFADISKARIDGAPVTSSSEQVRRDLGLPATS